MRFSTSVGLFSTLVKTSLLIGNRGVRRESNPYLLVHSQVCSDRYTTNTINAGRRHRRCDGPSFCCQSINATCRMATDWVSVFIST